MTRVNIKRVKVKKPSAKTMRNKCDKQWSRIIHSGGPCEICGQPTRDPHHVIGRKNFNLRWDLRNGVRLCFTHHTGGKYSAHNDPIWFMDWFKKHRPEDYRYLLREKNRTLDFINYHKVLEYLNVMESEIKKV